MSKNAGVKVVKWLNRIRRIRLAQTHPIFIGARATPLPITLALTANANVEASPTLELPLGADATQEVGNPFKVRVTIGLGVVGQLGSINILRVKRNPPVRQPRVIHIKPVLVAP